MINRQKALEKWSLQKATQAADHILYEQRETLFERLPFLMEKKALCLIRDGETEKLFAFLAKLSEQTVYVGSLSSDELRQEKYLAVTYISLAARAAIEGGVPEAEAYCLNDEIIQRADKMERVSDVRALIYRAIIQMSQLSRRYHQNLRVRTAAVDACVNYIDSHLHYAISLADLSRVSGLSCSHLCRRFKEETGLTPTEFIRKHRLAEARELLLEGQMDSSAVANVLGFSSQSYFIACFKKEFGITPGKYCRSKNKTPL
jgi:AraC-like DNA-binding protein